MANLGVDYASIDGNTRPDFVAAKQAGIKFVIPRAVYGRSVTSGSTKPFEDPVWQRDKQSILSAGLKKTAYIFVCYPRSGMNTP